MNNNLIGQLKQFDNTKGYKLPYEKVDKLLSPIVKEITAKGQEFLSQLHELIEHKETWSALFALQALAEIKDEKSIPYLVEFIKKNEEGDYWEGCEDAMRALQAIGKPAIKPLLEEVKKDFENKEYSTYTVGAVTGIKDDEVYQFMANATEGYIKNYKKDDDWLDIISLIYDFEAQGNKAILPMLEELSKLSHFSERERREIEDTMLIIEDREKFNREMEKELQNLSKDLNGIEGLFSKKKFNEEDYINRANKRDEDFEANFVCKKCNERQNIKTGLIRQMEGEDYMFENEIMCRHCLSHDIELSHEGKISLLSKSMGMAFGEDIGMQIMGKKVIVENKKINFNKASDYLQKRMKEEPENGELCLRAANNASKFNKHDEAIGLYEKSLQLDDTLIASYINLVNIYLHRDLYYQIKDAKPLAYKYFHGLIDLYNSHEYNEATLPEGDDIYQQIHGFAFNLGLQLKKNKLGRNEPCHCGSGIKYKKCCMTQDLKEFEESKRVD